MDYQGNQDQYQVPFHHQLIQDQNQPTLGLGQGLAPPMNQFESQGQGAKMSLNCHLQVPDQGQQGQGTNTPNTPEILNSIVGMQQSMQTQPFQAEFANLQSVNSIAASLSASEPTTSAPTATTSTKATKKDPVQAIANDLIKDSLKRKLQTKPKGQGGRKAKATPGPKITIKVEPAEGEPPQKKARTNKKSGESLTSTDEERRRRRRERNKVAATKCRNKKKARTMMLMKENETMTSQNQTMKAEIARLEVEKSNLMAVLSGHEGSCKLRNFNTDQAGSPSLEQGFPEMSEQQQSYLQEIKVELDNSSYVDPFADYASTSDPFGYNYNSTTSSAPFLGKGVMTYLDLDSRCTQLAL